MISNIEEQKFLKTAWKIIIFTALILTVYDNFGTTPLENLSIYNIHMGNLKAKQVGSQLNGFLFVTATILYLILQYRIERDCDEDRRKELAHDRWSCICVVILFIILWIGLFVYNPTVQLFTWRIWLQILYMSVFLLRFMLGHQNLMERVKTKFGIQRIITVMNFVTK